MNRTFNNFVQLINEVGIEGNPGISPEYLSSLNIRAAHNFADLRRKYGTDTINFMQYVIEAHKLQDKYKAKPALEELALEVMLDRFGSFLGDTILDIKFPEDDDEIDKMMKEEDPGAPDLDIPKYEEVNDPDVIAAVHKRKLTNMIAQGEALSAKELFTNDTSFSGLVDIFGEEDAIKYTALLVKIMDYAAMRDYLIEPEVTSKMLQNGGGFSGASQVDWEKQEDKNKPYKKDSESDDESPEESEQDVYVPKVVARGLDYAMLLHEAIKGIYELINQGGFAHLSEKDLRTVLMNADSIEDELEDFKRSRLVAQDLEDFINTFEEVAYTDNLKEHIWGKMISAKIMPDADFLKLMNLIYTSAPVYRAQKPGEAGYSDQEIAAANEAYPQAQKIIQELIDLITKEQEEWEDANYDATAYDDSYDDSYGGYDYDYADSEDYEYDEELPYAKSADEPDPMLQPQERPLSKSEIQKLIDDALDKGDFAEVAKLSKMLNEAIDYDDEP